MSEYNKLRGMGPTSASIVGGFIQQEPTPTTESLELTALAYDNAPKQLPKGLVQEAQALIDSLELPQNVVDIAYLEDAEDGLPSVPDEYSYRSESKALNRVSQQVTLALMQKHGLITEQDYRRFYTYGGSRAARESNYSCVYSTNTNTGKTQKRPIVPYRNQGGPTDILKMYYPSEDAIEPPLTNTRLIRGIAHELAHQIRRVNNDILWTELPTELVDYYLVKNGNPKVGGNMQGSESIAVMFSRYTLFKKQYGVEPTINDFVAQFALGLQRGIDKYKEQGKIKRRYFTSNYLTLGALVSLANAGYGNEKVSNILAMGLCGYVTIEKLPLLIKAGVITQEMVEKNKAVINDITNWFTTQEKGFAI